MKLCSDCGTPVPEADPECEGVVCGWCTQMRVMQYEYEQHLIASQYTPEDARLLRKTLKLTQEGLAYKLQIPITIVGQFERGEIDCPTEIQEWMDSNESYAR